MGGNAKYRNANRNLVLKSIGNITKEDQKKVSSFVSKYNINEVRLYEQYRRWEEDLNKTTNKKEIKDIQKRLDKMRNSFQHLADNNTPEFSNWKQDLDDYNGTVRNAVWNLAKQAQDEYDRLLHGVLTHQTTSVPNQYASIKTLLDNAKNPVKDKNKGKWTSTLTGMLRG